ncbi:MAG: hypothetical protein JJU21_03015 [Salinarimonas sp.]|nr:hypothetical protein [Salinarimonas sp.]
MSDSKALTSVSEADYEAIEGAVMETERGRWFLKEYARRNRAADTQMLLGAIERLESMMVQSREAQEKDRLRMDLLEMSRAISRTKQEISTLRPQGPQPNDLAVASEALDAIVRTTERATSDILEAAEQIQEAAWTLREEGASEAMCDELDRRATDIYTACSFQDLTAQRTTRIVDTLRFLEGRINAMIEIWGDGEAGDMRSEAGEGGDTARKRDLNDSLDDFNGLCQDGIDTVIIEDGGSDPVDAYFFHRGAEAEPPRLAEEIDLVADPVDADNSTDSASDIETKGLMQAADVDEVIFAEAGSVIEESDEAEAEAGAASIDDADVELEFGEVETPEADAPKGPMPEIDTLSSREKLRRFS